MTPSKFDPAFALVHDGLDPLPAIPLLVGGPPSAETIFTIHCVVEITQRSCGEAALIALNTGLDGDRLAEANTKTPTIVFFDLPDSAGRGLLLAAKVPIVLVSGGFEQTARYCMAARDFDMVQAAQLVSQSLCCLAPLRHHSSVRRVQVDRTTSIPDWIDEVASWLGLQRNDWQAERLQMLVAYADWATVGAAIDGIVPHSRIPAAPQDIDAASSDLLFNAMAASYDYDPISAVFWPASLILKPNGSAMAAGAAIPLVGPARLLTYGPYLHLPAGRWTACYQFIVDEHPAGNDIEFDVMSGGDVLVSNRVMLENSGKYGFECSFEIAEARLPVQMRAILAEGAIGGLFEPLGISLRRDELSG